MQAVSSGLQNISSKTPRDPVAAAMVADAVRIIDNYIKVWHELAAQLLYQAGKQYGTALWQAGGDRQG